MSTLGIPPVHGYPRGAAQRSGTGGVFGNGMTEKNMFLLILAAQLRNQDPLKPMDDTQFVTQLAQLHSLEQLQTLNDTLSALSLEQGRQALVQQAISLIGRMVTGLDDRGQKVQGIVESVRLIGDTVILRVAGRDLTAISEIGAPPPAMQRGDAELPPEAPGAGEAVDPALEAVGPVPEAGDAEADSPALPEAEELAVPPAEALLPDGVDETLPGGLAP